MAQTPYTVELELDVRAVAPASLDAGGEWVSPTVTGVTERRKVEGIVLENDYTIATFVPELGGRLISLLDKTCGVDSLQGSAGAPDGWLSGGLEITLDGSRRPNAFGPVRAAITDSGLRMSEVGAPGGIDFELIVSLEEGAYLNLELRARNRKLNGSLWLPGLLWRDQRLRMDPSEKTTIIYSESTQYGFGIVSDSELFADPPGGSIVAFSASRTLPPRWGTTISFGVVPVSGLGRPRMVSRIAALGLDEAELVIQPRSIVTGGKLVLLTSNGKTMEAPADLVPDRPLRYTLDELGGMPTALAILGEDRTELIRYPAEPSAVATIPGSLVYGEPAEATGLLDPAYRYWVAHLQSRDAFRRGDFAGAEACAETALLYNGEDPATWIEIAIAHRHLGIDDDDAPELLNAHYLAPLEPMLRAEGFLAQAGLDARAFLAPLADQPNELVEVACTYLDLGLLEDAARFIDAALSVAELPMLRYLYGYVCLVTGKMKTDAASAVASVRRLSPPYPWRPVEQKALSALVESFPGDQILREFLRLASG